jgi:hypothetical protein
MQTYVSTYLYLQIIRLSELQQSQSICNFRTKCSTMSLWQVCGIEISSTVKTSLEFEKKSGFQHRDWYTLHSVENSIHGFHRGLRLNKENLPSVLTFTPMPTVVSAKRVRCFSLKVSVTTESVRYLYPPCTREVYKTQVLNLKLDCIAAQQTTGWTCTFHCS